MKTDENLVSGVVLAGGRSSRMGRDKALLTHSGSGLALVAHQVETLRTAGCAEVLLSVREGTDYAEEVGAEVARVVDDGEGGPLPGIAAALARARGARVLVLAVDLPRMTVEALRELVAASTAECGAVWRGAHGWEPLCAVYPKATGAVAFEAARAAGRLSLQALIERGVTEGWMAEATGPADGGVLATWTSPGDVG
jgi:molybdopterin-guanine dinucleotide biosynthesis protein A